jgi:hypothetical protein
MVMSMTKHIVLILTLGILGCFSCTESSPQVSACAEEYYEGSVTFPDGATHSACSPARPEGMSIRFADPVDCRVLNAVGDGAGAEAAWTVGGEGEWFTTTGPKENMFLSYDPNASLHPSFCVSGDPLYCDFHRNDCRFEVTRAGHAPGDVVEGRLLGSCTMYDPLNPPPGTWTPVVTSLRFRVHLSTAVINDAGATCAYP